ncbi:MAG: rod shape-determining protein MreC [Pseudomonadota bacterium]
MFSKKTMIVVCVIILVTANIIVLSVSSKHRYPPSTFGRIALIVISPLQNVLTQTVNYTKNIWKNYFYLVSMARENDRLKKEMGCLIQKNNEYHEAVLSNIRFRSLLDFRQSIPYESIAAEVISVDPSMLYRTVVIDKGKINGVKIGLPVIAPQGIVGQVIDAADHYSRVLLILDQESSVDAVVQESRARGIIKGASSDQCIFKYILRRHEIKIWDSVISSGLDGVYPKGLPIGHISYINKKKSGLFQEVKVTPHVDFNKLEEVLVLINQTPKSYTNNK